MVPRVSQDLTARRLRAQQLSAQDFRTAAEVVGAFGAIQAQDVLASRWAVGIRLPPGALTERGVAEALDSGALIRIHAMRWTWQLVAAADVRWLLALIGPRMVGKYRGRHAQLGLT